MFESSFGESIIGRAINRGIIELKVHNLRNWAWNDYGAVDDRPFGGGVGMLIRVDVVDKALKGVVGDDYQKNKTEKPGWLKNMLSSTKKWFEEDDVSDFK